MKFSPNIGDVFTNVYVAPDGESRYYLYEGGPINTYWCASTDMTYVFTGTMELSKRIRLTEKIPKDIIDKINVRKMLKVLDK